MAGSDPLKHIRIDGYSTAPDYTYPKEVKVKFDVKARDRNLHGNQILEQLQQVKERFSALRGVELPAGIVRDDAVYVEFISEWGFSLKFESLEEDKQDPYFQILNIREEKREIEGKVEFRYKVNLMMTEGGVSKFIKKVRDYLSQNVTRKDRLSGLTQDTGVPKNNPLINNIQKIQLATLQSLWTDSPEIPFPNENDPVWWEVWFRKTANDEVKIGNVLDNLKAIGDVGISLAELEFAEHRVRLVRGTARQLSSSLLLLDNLAELRKPQETADFLINERDNYDEQKEWLEDLNRRTAGDVDENSVLICLLDTGVTNNHPLISSFLPDNRMYTYKEDWGNYDSYPTGGHGTGVAGLALYGDMVNALGTPHNIRIYHALESFKILQVGDATDPELYGAVTEYAVSTPLTDRPNNPRVFCMTVTAKEFSFNGRPSAWSAAIDKLAFGSFLSPLAPQLFIVSGGNVIITKHDEFPHKNYLESVHDPGQAYNAITVGTYTRKDKIPADTGLRHLAANGDMAPSNSTSTTWDHQWPLKPDIVMEGGNSATDGIDVSDHASLKPLSVDSEYPKYIFLPFGDTSGAAALTAKMAAELRTAYPNLWPETIRALMIHSADWTEAMRGNQAFDNLSERDRINILRSVGYGVPLIEKALYSAKNSLTLVAEREIQPYRLEGSSPKTNEYHLFELPWPKDILNDALYDQNVTLKLTLSYFIEPNPGSRIYANNFQYRSHDLDFAVIKPHEDLRVFRRRISADAILPDDERNHTDEEWSIRRVRSRGSVKKDFITMSGADMAERNKIAVYPKSGWYKTRKKLGKAESKVRYSLIISLETPNTEVDIYTPVLNQIKIPILV